MNKKTFRIYLLAVFFFLIFIGIYFRSYLFELFSPNTDSVINFILFIDQYSGFLEGAAVICSLILFLWNQLHRFISISSEVENQNQSENLLIKMDSIKPEKKLGKWGGKVSWVDRKLINISDLSRERKIVLVGPMKLGKTREALELIASSIEHDLVIENNIFVPNLIAIKKLPDSLISSLLENELYGKNSIIIYLDNLQNNFYGSTLKNLGRLLEISEKLCQNTYVVATTQSEKMLKQHKTWLKNHEFSFYEVKTFTKKQSEKFIKNALNLFQISSTDKAKQVLIDRNNGSPEHMLSVLLELKESNQPNITLSDAIHYMSREIETIWFNNRRLIHEKDRLAGEIIHLLSIFNSAGVKPFKKLIMSILFFQNLKKERFLKIINFHSRFKASTKFLSEFDIITGQEVFIAPEVVYEKIQPSIAQSHLAKLALENDRFFRKFTLRFLFDAVDQHNGLIHILHSEIRDHPNLDFEIKVRLEKRREAFLYKILKDMEINLEPEILRVPMIGNRNHITLSADHFISPHQLSTNLYPFVKKGFDFLATNERALALDSFDQALRLDSSNPYPYYGKSLIHWGWGDRNEAINLCLQAVKIDENFVDGYAFLGLMYRQENDFDLAHSMLEKCIELDPYNEAGHIGLALIELLNDSPLKALSLLENLNLLIPDSRSITYFLKWLRIMTSENSTDLKLSDAFVLFLDFLPELNRILINYTAIEFDRVLSDAIIITETLMPEFTGNNELISPEEFYIFVALINFLENNIEETVHICNRALTIFAKSDENVLLEINLMLGKALQYLGLVDEAIDLFEKLLENNLDEEQAYLGLTQTYLAEGQYEKAIDHCFKAIHVNQYSFESNLLLALCYKRMGLSAKFNSQLESLIALKKLNPYDNARISALKGDQEAALSNLKQTFTEEAEISLDILIDPCFLEMYNYSDGRTVIEESKMYILIEYLK